MRPSVRLLAPVLALAASLGGCQCGPGATPSPAPAEPASAAASAAPAPPEPGLASPGASAEAPPEPRFVGLAQILVAYKGAEPRSRGDPRQGDARARAEEALARLKDQKGTFEELAKQYSDDPTKVIGGAMGNYERSALPPELADVAFALEIGQSSAIVETARGFHILRRIR